MNGILGLTALIQGTNLSLEQRQYVDGVKVSAETLMAIINDILDFSKIEAGRLDLEAIDFDLHELLGNTLKSLAVSAQVKGLELLLDIGPDVPAEIVGDPSRLRQIIVNLVGNAVKFTSHGEITVSVVADESTDDATLLHFVVSDTGIGIPANKHQAIFEAFTQADGSSTRNYGGTGLGLTISAQLVAMMGGRMWVESKVNDGSKFHFTARFELGGIADTDPSALLSPALQNLRVLVVEDNATNRRILQNVLAGWHMLPVLVDSGTPALAALQDAIRANQPFGLILLDLAAPGIDGFDLLEFVRQHPEIARSTILMLNAASPSGEFARCRELGLGAYLIKPIKPSELLNAIVTALAMAPEPNEPPAAAAPSTTQYLEGLRVLVAEDNAINRLVVVRILERAGHQVTVAINGQEALTALTQAAFDLVLMDVQMPIMDGFEATGLIRAQEKESGQHMPIVAMTAHAMKGDRERCESAGMDGYVSKPIEEEVLFAEIESAITSLGQTGAKEAGTSLALLL